MQALFANGRIIIGIILAGLIGFGLSSCGSSTNNDQGVSFNLMGFFAEFPDSTEGCTLPTGSAGGVMALANGADDGSLEQQGVLTIAGFQNALSGQFIRVDQASISYDIPGASQNPPSTSFPTSLLINPSAVNEIGGGSSLPPSYNSDIGCAYTQFFVVPADIQTWINFNRDSLPEAPFSMTAFVHFSGITSAGDRIDTNVAPYRIYVSPDPVIAEGDSTSGSETTDGAESLTDADSGVDSGSEEQL